MPVVFEQEMRTDDDGVEHSSYQRYLGYREDARSAGPDGTGTIRGASKVPLDLSENRKYIINPGSVGQPRDRDPWACWAVLEYESDSDQMMISFRRTYYDWHRVLEMIRRSHQTEDQIPYRLDEFLGARLERGH
jgi:diadenosine tetraphosphatase ApaH/serine/threonine PP2A family protein phosphatase